MRALQHAFLLSMGNGGGGDADGGLLLFPVLSEPLVPSEVVGWGFWSSDLQLFVFVPGTSQQQSEIAAPSLPPHSDRAARERKRGSVTVIGLADVRGKTKLFPSVPYYQHEGAMPTTMLIWPCFTSLPCHTAELGQV